GARARRARRRVARGSRRARPRSRGALPGRCPARRDARRRGSSEPPRRPPRARPRARRARDPRGVLRGRERARPVSPTGGRSLVRAAWTLAVALLAILVLKTFVCDVKHVESSSMEPTIFGSPTDGESVLVLYVSLAPHPCGGAVLAREGGPRP